MMLNVRGQMSNVKRPASVRRRRSWQSLKEEVKSF
jgi:hypothetical protein